jgi:hypothetical protein
MRSHVVLLGQQSHPCLCCCVHAFHLHEERHEYLSRRTAQDLHCLVEPPHHVILLDGADIGELRPVEPIFVSKIGCVACVV